MSIKARLDQVYSDYVHVSYSELSDSVRSECLECGKQCLEKRRSFYPEVDARDIGVNREYQELIPNYETGCAIIRSPENCKVEWVEIKTVLPKIPHEDPQEFFEGIQNYKDYFQETEEADPSQRP